MQIMHAGEHSSYEARLVIASPLRLDLHQVDNLRRHLAFNIRQRPERFDYTTWSLTGDSNVGETQFGESARDELVAGKLLEKPECNRCTVTRALTYFSFRHACTMPYQRPRQSQRMATAPTTADK